jgi:hypothetical protein
MSLRTPSVLLAVALATCIACASSASAATWRNVTGDTHTNLTAVQAASGGPGTALHVVWVGPETDLNTRSALYERDVLANGTLGATHVLLGGTSGMTNPSIARNPVDGHMWVFAAGAGVQGGKLLSLSSSDGFVSTTTPTPISTNGYAYAPDDSSAAFSAAGDAFLSYGVTFKHGLGVDPAEDDLGAAPGFDAGLASRCCVYWSQVALDGVSGAPMLGWYSNVDPDRAGLEVVSLTTGAVQYVPGSADAGRHSSANGDMATPITGRIGAGGVFVGYCGGYPTCTKALVWRVGAAKPVVVGSGSMKFVRIAAAPGGRLWAFWTRDGILWARRSNPTATAWGTPVGITVPGGTHSTIWRTAGDASRGALDAFVSLQLASGANTTYTTRVLPGLTVVTPAHGMLGTKLAVTVRDAGAPVAGAKVTIRGHVGVTNAAGVAKVLLTGKTGFAVVTASRVGYSTGSVRMHLMT